MTVLEKEDFMILGAIIAGAALIAGTSLLAAFWNDITEWLKRAFIKVREVVQAAVLGTKVFIQRFRQAFKEVSKHYSKKGLKWQETIVTKEISANEVPDEIKQKLANCSEADITDDYELALENA